MSFLKEFSNGLALVRDKYGMIYFKSTRGPVPGRLKGKKFTDERTASIEARLYIQSMIPKNRKTATKEA